MTHRVYVNGRVHVRARQCSTCIFGPRRPVTLDRVEGMVAAATADDAGSIPCHHHLHVGAPIEPVCRGFYDRHATVALRLATLMDLVTLVDDDGVCLSPTTPPATEPPDRTR